MYKDGSDFLEFWGQHLIKDTLIQKGEVWGKFYRNDFFFFSNSICQNFIPLS